MKVYVFGNPLLRQDSLPLRLLPRLREEFPQVEFIEADPTTDQLEDMGTDPVIIDSASGIGDVHVITDLDHLYTHQPLSLHDFDLAMHLKLMKKVGKIQSATIIALPMEASESQVWPSLKNTLAQIIGEREPSSAEGTGDFDDEEE